MPIVPTYTVRNYVTYNTKKGLCGVLVAEVSIVAFPEVLLNKHSVHKHRHTLRKQRQRGFQRNRKHNEKSHRATSYHALVENGES